MAAPPAVPLIDIRRLAPADARDYRALMLESYATAPGAFTSTHAESATQSADWWSWRLAPGDDADEQVFGAWRGNELVGAVGWQRNRRERTMHKALMFGLYVTRSARRAGTARTLAQTVMHEAVASPGILVMQLTVTSGNAPARRLYESLGFEVFGIEPMATRHGARFLDKIHMWRTIDR